MDNQVHNQIVSFIWGIADDCLRDIYVRGKYRDVILPMTVIRRLDALLEDTKPAVLEMKEKLDAAGIDNQWPALCNAAGQAFCNASPFLLKDLTSRAKKQTLKADFEAYLDGFSPNVKEILEKFKFRNQIDTMIEADILGAVIEKFVSSDINLSPNPIYKDEEKTILKYPGLDNHGMGTIFEELIRRFNEENNEEAGEHWTPRDVVELMADLIFMPIADQIKDATYSCYDGACGTGGMLTVAQERLQTLATRRGKNVSIHLFGQEINPETYAICKADMLLKGDGEQADHISYGSTLSLDGNATRQFDFMLSNPPYGKSWKTDADKMGGKKEILDTRFNAYLEGGEQLTMLPRTSDGQLLFLLNNVSKMKTDTPLGSRIAEVHALDIMKRNGNPGQKGTGNDLGEILLYVFLEQVLGAPKIMSKVELQTGAKQYGSKCDGIHLLSLEQEFSGNAIYYTYAFYLIAKYRFNVSYNENLHLTSLWFFYASLVSLYTGSFESTVENHLNSIKELTSLEEYKRFILSRVEERLTNDYFDITLIGSEGLAVSGRGNNAWNAYVAALNILNAKILFSKSNLLVSKLFEPGTDGKRKSLEKHHLFPKAYLKTLGYNDAKINQMANYAFIDWKDNMEILDEAPSIYYPVVCEGRSPEEIQRMEEENALPYGWENMPYEDFLIERRKLMAAKIKAAFEQLKKNVE